jgi:hypothetical protein
MVVIANNTREERAPDRSSSSWRHGILGIAAALTVSLAALAVTFVAPTLISKHSTPGSSRRQTLPMISKISGGPEDVTRSDSDMLPPDNPSSNLAPVPNILDYCSGATVDTSAGCQTASLEAIDRGRTAEGLGPMVLPSDWSSLSPAEQLFVATNLERTARGLDPFSGMSTLLDSVAGAAAASGTDAVPPGGFASFWTSNWAGGVGSALEAVYLWMYDDGFKSPNVECQPGNMTGCWGHRDDMLAPFRCSPCVLGAAVSANAYDGEPSWAEVMADTTGSPAIALAWSSVEASADSTVVGMSSNALKGYWLVTASGEVHSFGGAPYFGSATVPPGEEAVGLTSAPGGGGYWIVTSNGSVYAFGDAHFYGSANVLHLSSPIVGMTPTPDGQGYWLVGADGGVFCYGNASFHGSTGAIRLNKPVVGIASTSNGEGYWLVASDGGVFTFGNAVFHGSTGGIRLNKPVVGMTPIAGSGGYWLVASDGGIFCFGDASFHGSTGAMRLAAPMVGMASPTSSGYWLVASDGGIFSFGLPFHGSMA